MTKAELKWAVGCAAAVMGVTLIPYVVMWWYTPFHTFYTWMLFNQDDHAVYYTWIRQAQDGHLLFRNLYTVEPQRGIYLHLYFLFIGQLARIPFLDVEGADHLGRLFFGGLTLVLVYRLAALFTTDRFTRRVVFWTTAVSAGFGWLFWHNISTLREPVDVWQPEAITFASLYTNGLFCVSMALMLGVVICLLLAEERGWKYAVGAGACGFVLANIHTYDLFHLTAAWSAYLLLRGIVERRIPREALVYALIAAAVTTPSFAYMYWFFKTEPVFSKRVEVPTLSPEFREYLLGYGLILPLAAWGCVLLWKRFQAEEPETTSPKAPASRWVLPLAWCAAGFLVAYAPVAFQRKMVMGTHFPLALLAGVAVAELGRRAAKQSGRPLYAGLTAGLIVAAMTPSMIRFLVRDVQVGLTTGMDSTHVHPIYWDETEIAAFRWMRNNTPPDARLMTFPFNGVLAPAYADRAVYSGHWGETPNFMDTLKVAVPFYWGYMDSATRRETLRALGINYVLDSHLDEEYTAETVAEARSAAPPRRPLSGEPFLIPVFQQGETILYEVR